MLWATQERATGSAHRLTRRQRAAALTLALVACCFIALDLSGSSLRAAHDGARGALGSLYRGTDSVLGPIRRFVQGIPTAGSNASRVHALQHQNALLRDQLANATANKKTLSQLGKLQLAADDLGKNVLPARVIALSPTGGFDWTVTVDTGTADGVRVGQSVTDGYGLVGRVLHADASSAVVLLAVDPGSGVGARDLRNGAIGVATGAGSKGLTFRSLDVHATLRVGDELSTGPSAIEQLRGGPGGRHDRLGARGGGRLDHRDRVAHGGTGQPGSARHRD